MIGIDAPAVDGARNALVHRARARVSVRLAPGAGPGRGAAHRGASICEAAAPWNVKVKITAGAVGEGFLARTDGPAYAAATDALEAAFGKDVVHYGEGGSIPLVAAFREAQPAAEMILWGCEEPQCKIHAPNESVDLGELERMVLAEALFLDGMGAGAEWSRRRSPLPTTTERRAAVQAPPPGRSFFCSARRLLLHLAADVLFADVAGMVPVEAEQAVHQGDAGAEEDPPRPEVPAAGRPPDDDHQDVDDAEGHRL